MLSPRLLPDDDGLLIPRLILGLSFAIDITGRTQHAFGFTPFNWNFQVAEALSRCVNSSTPRRPGQARLRVGGCWVTLGSAACWMRRFRAGTSRLRRSLNACGYRSTLGYTSFTVA